MILKFWGVRGSIPTPSAETVRFGGNTSCLSADLGGNMVIFDAGTGIRNLGNTILERKDKPKMDMFLSHVHWDHIQGFPFFGPGYRNGYAIDVYGRGKADNTLGEILAGQMEGPNFPVSLHQLGAKFTYSDITPGQSIDIKSPAGEVIAKVTCAQGCHPNGVLVYRLDDLRKGTALVYATDTEHYANRMDLNIGDLAQGADLLIYDGMYTPEEYESKYKGWGHSTWEKGFELAIYAKVKKYVVFHHDPGHTDDFLEGYEAEVKDKCRTKNPRLEVSFAREKMEIPLG
ncbi:MAG TPA: MBL fold metallo-hydrolase [Fibrobacteria bacterium]|nr:MBL fold metallo-hydrolase [Fibrobacteria bacterium]